MNMETPMMSLSPYYELELSNKSSTQKRRNIIETWSWQKISQEMRSLTWSRFSQRAQSQKLFWHGIFELDSTKMFWKHQSSLKLVEERSNLAVIRMAYAAADEKSPTNITSMEHYLRERVVSKLWFVVSKLWKSSALRRGKNEQKEEKKSQPQYGFCVRASFLAVGSWSHFGSHMWPYPWYTLGILYQPLLLPIFSTFQNSPSGF